VVRGVNRHVDLFRERRELVDGGGAVEVAGDEQRPAAFLFQAVGELGGSRRLARAVQSTDQDAGGRVEVEWLLVAAKQAGEFVVEDFDDLLARFDRLEDFGAERLVLHLGDEILGDAEFDVGFEQGDADFAQRVGDVLFGDVAESAEFAERVVEAVGEAGKHGKIRGWG
jgi:hypothetical protein